MASIHCTQETIRGIELQIEAILKLISEYRWIVDAYVVEFFVKGHWSRLPQSWQHTLDSLVPTEIASHLMEVTPSEERKYSVVWPLSLLAFRSATQALSIKRHCIASYEGAIQHEGVDKYFNLHVNNKKRHEIRPLAQLIFSACKSKQCEKVIDVGGGRGHLTRLLSFGYRLKVTSIEAAGCHISGATKVDKKVKTLLCKKMKKDGNSSVNALEPSHVICTIQPDISVDKFLAIISKQFRTVNENYKDCSNEVHFDRTNLMSETFGMSSEPHDASSAEFGYNSFECKNIKTHQRIAGEQRGNVGMTGSKEVKELILDDEAMHGRLSEEDNFALIGLHTCGDLAPTILRVFTRCPFATVLTSVGCCYMKMECALIRSKSKNSSEDNQSDSTFKNSVNKHSGMDLKIDHGSRNFYTNERENIFEIVDNRIDQSNKGNITKSRDDPLKDVSVQSSTSQAIPHENILWHDVSCANENVTGTCIDRNNVCKTRDVSRTLDNVKLDNQHGSCSDKDGFPMSRFLKKNENCMMGFEALELACHFYDSYYQRLKEKDPSLIFQAYRAVLEILIQRKKPELVRKHAGIRLIKKATASVKKHPHLTFMEYAELALLKLGLTFDKEEAAELESQLLIKWSNVITFHSLRLCIAPVMESLILLDRMIYLLEQDIPSELIPVFDPSVSPRNFVLLATKP